MQEYVTPTDACLKCLTQFHVVKKSTWSLLQSHQPTALCQRVQTTCWMFVHIAISPLIETSWLQQEGSCLVIHVAIDDWLPHLLYVACGRRNASSAPLPAIGTAYFTKEQRWTQTLALGSQPEREQINWSRSGLIYLLMYFKKEECSLYNFFSAKRFMYDSYIEISVKTAGDKFICYFLLTWIKISFSCLRLYSDTREVDVHVVAVAPVSSVRGARHPYQSSVFWPELMEGVCIWRQQHVLQGCLLSCLWFWFLRTKNHTSHQTSLWNHKTFWMTPDFYSYVFLFLIWAAHS